jgi:tetratricopeptide (TPR) repeat protein
LIDLEEETVPIEERARDGTTAVVERVRDSAGPDPAEAVAHRDLAVAYLGMGRHEDAIAEVERAIASDPGSAPESVALLGRCHLERGAPGDAVDAYRRALATARLSTGAAAAVRFELGSALERLGDLPGALAQLVEVARMEPGHQGVEERIAAIAARGAAPPGAAASPPAPQPIPGD